MGFRDDISIDRHELDKEWVRQAELFYEYSEQYAEALYERDKLKDQLELLSAQLDSQIRNDPEKFKIYGKVTEGSIQAAIIQNEEYIDLKESYLLASKDANVLQAAKSALEHKKVALETLAKLYLSGYWAETKIPEEVRDKYSRNEMEKDLNDNPRLKTRTRRSN